MPPNTVAVDRNSPWGNPFKAGEDATWWGDAKRRAHDRPTTAAEAVANYRAFVTCYLDWNDGRFNYRHISELRGKNLACWCPLTYPDGTIVPCHADVLLELANGEAGGLRRPDGAEV